MAIRDKVTKAMEGIGLIRKKAAEATTAVEWSGVVDDVQAQLDRARQDLVTLELEPFQVFPILRGFPDLAKDASPLSHEDGGPTWHGRIARICGTG